jgi:hypothetical protein
VTQMKVSLGRGRCFPLPSDECGGSELERGRDSQIVAGFKHSLRSSLLGKDWTAIPKLFQFRIRFGGNEVGRRPGCRGKRSSPRRKVEERVRSV